MENTFLIKLNTKEIKYGELNSLFQQAWGCLVATVVLPSPRKI
jgi:hypothetical protein